MITKLSRAEDYSLAKQFKEGQEFLFEGAYRSIIFNVVITILLALYLVYHECPLKPLVVWLTAISIVSCIRIFHCKFVIKHDCLSNFANFHLYLFTFLTLLTGVLWTSIYFIALPYIDEPQQYVIILAFGGMSAGAAASLAVYFPAFMAYVLAIFMPVIIYNYAVFDMVHIILASMFLMFLIVITISAKAHQMLLYKIFSLTEQNIILSERFEMLAITDSLTGLYNRRYFTDISESEYNRAKQNYQSFVLVSIDIDNFKLINDNFGHPFGDKFLIYTAAYLKSFMRRANDLIFRLGGDEFAMLLVNVTEEKTRDICNEIKNKYLSNPKFEYEPQDQEHQIILKQVSLSMGVVYVEYGSTAKIDQIIEKADELLYHAKKEGKNNINYVNGI